MNISDHFCCMTFRRWWTRKGSILDSVGLANLTDRNRSLLFKIPTKGWASLEQNGFALNPFQNFDFRCLVCFQKSVAETLYVNHLQQIYKHFERKQNFDRNCSWTGNRVISSCGGVKQGLFHFISYQFPMHVLQSTNLNNDEVASG